MNEAIEFQKERINALEGKRIIDIEANYLFFSNPKVIGKPNGRDKHKRNIKGNP